MASRGARDARSSRNWRVRVARFSSRRVRTRSAIVSPLFAYFTLSAYKDSISLKEDRIGPHFSRLANSLTSPSCLFSWLFMRESHVTFASLSKTIGPLVQPSRVVHPCSHV